MTDTTLFLSRNLSRNQARRVFNRLPGRVVQRVTALPLARKLPAFLFLAAMLLMAAPAAHAGHDPKIWSEGTAISVTATPNLTEGSLVSPSSWHSFNIQGSDSDSYQQRWWYIEEYPQPMTEFWESNNEADEVTFTWTCSGGEVVGYNGGTDAIWTAPTAPGVYTITCTVDDVALMGEDAWGAGPETGDRDDEAEEFSIQVQVDGKTWSPTDGGANDLSGSTLFANVTSSIVDPGQTVDFSTLLGYDTDSYSYPGMGIAGYEPDIITCAWSATGGSVVAGTDGTTATWTAPTTPGTYTVTCRFDDVVEIGALDHGSRDDDYVDSTFELTVPSRVWGPDVGLLTNTGQAPTITSPIEPLTGPYTVAVGDTVALSAEEVTDNDSWVQNTLGGTGADAVSYSWSAMDAAGNAAGNFPDGATTRNSSWVAPITPGTYTLTCAIEDVPTAVVAPDQGDRDDNGWLLTRQVTVSRLDHLQYMDVINNPTWQDMPANGIVVPLGTQLAFQALSDQGFPTGKPVWSGTALTVDDGTTNPPTVSCDTAGTYTLAVACGNSKASTITVVSAAFADANAVVKVGQNKTITATVSPATAFDKVVFESADPLMASVDVLGTQNGTVTLQLNGVALGTTELRVRLGADAGAPTLATLGVWVNSTGLDSNEIAVRPAARIRRSSQTTYLEDGKSSNQVTVANEPVEYRVLVRNDNISNEGIGNDTLKVTGPAGSNGWDIAYYEVGPDDTRGEPITDDITSTAGWLTGNLAETQSREIIVEVSSPAGAGVPDENFVVLTVTSTVDAGKSDNVVASTAILSALDLQVVNPGSSRQISLEWANSPAATLYKVYRRTGTTGNFAELNGQVTRTGRCSYTDLNLRNNTTYAYKVRAYASIAEYSKVAESIIVADTTAVLPEPILTNATGGDKSVALSWGNVDEAWNYRVYRAPVVAGVTGTYALIGTALAPATTFTNNSLINGLSFSYKIRAWNSGGESVDSNALTAGVQGEEPEPPILLHATAGENRVRLQWTPSVGAARYRIYRAVAQDCENTPAESEFDYLLSTNFTWYLDPNVTNGTTYFYMVTAEDEVPQESDFSNAKCATPTSGVVDLMIRNHGEDAYSGALLYDADGSGQSKSQATPSSVPAVYIVKLVNRGGAASFKILGQAVTAGWQVKYFDHIDGGAEHEITTDLLDGGWDIEEVPADGELLLRVEVTPEGTIAPNQPYPTEPFTVVVNAERGGTPAMADAVQAITLRQRQVKELHYSYWQEGAAPQWVPVPSAGLKVPVGTTLQFKAILNPESERWPDDTPIWSGTVGADPTVANAAITEPIVFNTASTSAKPHEVVAARCDNEHIVSTAVRVINVQTVQYSFNNGAFRDVPAAGLGIPTGVSVRFRAVSASGTEVWPEGKPVWTVKMAGHEVWPENDLAQPLFTTLAGTGRETATVTFDAPLPDEYQLKVECGNSKAVTLQVVKPIDVAIRNADEDVYGAERSQQVVPGFEPAKYYIRVSNSGAVAEVYGLSAIPAPANWNVHYFDADGNDITAAITGSGWPDSNSPSLTVTAGEDYEVRMEVSPTSSVPTGQIMKSVLVVTSSENPMRRNEVTASTLRQRLLGGIEISRDQGTTWSPAPTDGEHPVVKEGETIGLKAVAASGQAWPKHRPVWNKNGVLLYSSKIWVSFSGVLPSAQFTPDLRQVSVECGDSAAIQIRVVPNYDINVMTSKRSLMAGGNNCEESKATLTAVVMDWEHRPMPGLTVNFSARYADGTEAGTINTAGTGDDNATTDTSGRALVTFTAGTRTDEATIQATVSGAGSSGTMTAQTKLQAYRAFVSAIVGTWTNVNGEWRRPCKALVTYMGRPVAGRAVTLTGQVIESIDEETLPAGYGNAAPIETPTGVTGPDGIYTTYQKWIPPVPGESPYGYTIEADIELAS